MGHPVLFFSTYAHHFNPFTLMFTTNSVVTLLMSKLLSTFLTVVYYYLVIFISDDLNYFTSTE